MYLLRGKKTLAKIENEWIRTGGGGKNIEQRRELRGEHRTD